MSFTCTTGQVDGDKQIEGDMKTPEGVYFVNGFLNIQTDYPKYGGAAYPLNYPNPVDRLRQKKGYGIWIHGRGKELVPKDTLGCVALSEISQLGAYLPYGTPVIIAESIDLSGQSKEEQTSEITEVANAAKGWNKAWADRSEAFFDYYDAAKYTASTENFSAFAANKRRLFARLPWIKIETGEINIIKGPGYWVSYFFQSYKSPSILAEGTRRLYWERDTQGRLKIIGMEWVKAPKTREDMFLARQSPPEDKRTTMETPGDAVVVAATEDKSSPLLSAPAEKSADIEVTPADTESAAGKDMPRQPLVASTAETTRPEVLVATALENKSFSPAYRKETENTPAEKKLPPVKESGQTETDLEKPGVQHAGQTSVENKKGANEKKDPTTEIKAVVESWRKAWLKADLKSYMSFYAADARQGKNAGRSSIEKHKKGLWKTAAPLKIRITGLKCKIKGDTATVTFTQTYSGANGLNTKGLKTLILKQRNNRWLIIKETWG